jgi:hypothetical protein
LCGTAPKLWFRPPADASGLAIITADVAFDQWDLREWTEAMVSVNEPRGR